MMTERARLKGWEKRLMRLTQEELRKPFSWSQSNCGDVMAASVLACYGPEHPLIAELIHDVNPDNVKARLMQVGGLAGILNKHLESIIPTLGQDGDLALFGEGDAPAGCVLLSGQAVGKGFDGKVYRLPINQCKVWML